MPGFCLLPQQADALAAKFRAGELDADSLIAMGSEGRRSAFADIVGESNAADVNASFESKLLLKHQQEGLANWVKSLDKVKPEVQRDLLARVQRMDRVLEPKEQDAFLADLAQQKLGFRVTMSEAAKLTELAKNVSDAKDAGDWEGYVAARVAFREGAADIRGHASLSVGQGIAHFVRAGALSWPTTIAKLTSVALSRVITTPITDAAALAVSKALPALAEGAPRYGTKSASTALQSEIAAQTAMWTDGIVDAGRLLQNKGSRLDVAFGKSEHIGHAWYEYFGSIHGALKEPIKRAEFARSLYRRTEEAAARGEDVKDMDVRLRLSTEAWLDGQRAVSMNDNVISSAWNAGMRRLEQVDPKTGKPNPLGSFLATVARIDMPIIKAPTNVVLEASEYIGGLLTGGARAAWEYAHGLEGLKPLERDAIIRQISKGSVGAALMALYYFKHDQVKFGGFYEPGEKRSADDVPQGAMRVGDVTIPKQMLHNPMIEAGQFAATVGRVSKAKHADDAEGYASAVGAAAVGLIDEVPVVGNLPKDLKSLSDPDTRGNFLDKKLATAAVPGIVQWIAKATDDAPKRYPKGLTENVKATLPGLRQSVPTKKRSRK